ncbi:TonB-dependent receptor [Flexithrix dorotheae]|uniref:TonB-dependent receptor n=1 Tax=Flexithrix dorotheae TaxID=70993 RepID=UPI000372A243|nr:TonB-dependent receptor [Flexithrix dorotheae]
MKFTVIIFALLLSQNTFGQITHLLKGKVTDKDGKGLPHATIKTGENGTISDVNGEFRISLTNGSHEIRVSSIGFINQTHTLTIPDQKEISFILEEDVQRLNEVVVSATRTSRSIENIPLPVSVIKAEEIEKIGALRLDEVLLEQAGMQIVSDHGTGLQMQGLSSDYILFLIDGEPIIGRTAGTLDLSRLAVDNIERIEVIKGPASSLYGSEAMAGVVNIITKKPKEGFSTSIRARYRTFQTSDLNTTVGYASPKSSASIFFNRVGSNGYDLNEETLSQTIPEYSGYTFNPKFAYKFSDKVNLSINSRLYTENQENVAELTVNEEELLMQDKGKRSDWNLMPTLEIKLKENHHLQLRGYHTAYKTETQLINNKDQSIYENSYFDQFFNRLELQYDWYINEENITTIGFGATNEQVKATNYEDIDEFKANYAFLQYQWIPSDRFNMILGGRFDHHNAYASRFSPKLAAGYQINNWITMQASFGGGYKSPDFRQLILNFTNPVAGYTVIGSTIVQDRMEELTEQGQIETVFIDPATIETIKAESSIAYNLGFDLTPGKKSKISFNFFRNEISNLIDTAPIARKTNGQNVFSYFNFDEVITQGVDVKGDYKLLPNLNFSLGYQYLDSKNIEDINKIKNGEIFKRDPATNRTQKVTLEDYGGLVNRSRHSGNAKLFYINNRYNFDMSLRTIYRGKWGVGDANGNGIIDSDNEYADGYILLNLAVNKQLFSWITIESGINNILDVTNSFEPSLPGRIWYGGINIKLSQKNK